MKWDRLPLIIITLLITVPPAFSSGFEQANYPSLISSVREQNSLMFCGEKVSLENQELKERLEKELLLTLWNRPQVILWLKRSRRFLPSIEKILKDNNMPDDLKYVAIAESALRAHAGSKKGAIGFWQFLPDTGRRYGLTINEYIDERRNLFSSTQAASQYFKELYKTMGSWTLAVAAFNMGEEGLKAEIIEQKTNDYYELYLPLETQQFVFRILSVKMIFLEPEKFGFKLSEKDYYPPLTFDRVQFECFQEIPIRIIAQAANTPFKVIKDLNPEIRGHYLVEGRHSILIPKGAAKGFGDRYQKLLTDFQADKNKRIYIVKDGDNLSSIAEKFEIPLAVLIIWNRVDLEEPIYPGQRLVIYPRDEQYLE